jgi:hypothetical protein
MNEIKKIPLEGLGYNFIPAPYLPKGKDEYYLRNHQNRSGINYRQLTAQEIEILVRNRNSSSNWNDILVGEFFNPQLVQNNKFFGLVRIGNLEALYAEYHSVKWPVGIYNSTIISCDFGHNVVIDSVHYLSHYIIGNDAVITNVNEMSCMSYAKFGNGIVKEGEAESVRIWMELCNENGGRSVIPFSSMLPGDAYLWTRNRDDEALMKKFVEFTEKKYETKRGFYGKVGDRSIIKNCEIIKDVWVGSDAYIKGANKLKNLTINSDANRKSQIGEGCEIVNGIIGYGCRVFYGVKAVRFVMASHSQLKYGARLINSYLGNNATVSCCEVLNSLIFPGHEQHHNNSFLCAALIMGQSNMAAGATIGSNHNSRAADGEIIANRGFWPGLCVSLKHNSKFASFTMIAKGDYPAELHNPFPFALINNDVSKDQLQIMPAYWWMYNRYALARNADKYSQRDNRTHKVQHIDYSFLAPDTANEILEAIDLINEQKHLVNDQDELVLPAHKYENSKRTVVLIKATKAYEAYHDMLMYYALTNLVAYIEENGFKTFATLKKHLNFKTELTYWENVGGQLIPVNDLQILKEKIKKGRIKSWDEIRVFYKAQGDVYAKNKFNHAWHILLTLTGQSSESFTKKVYTNLINSYYQLEFNHVQAIYDSRKKDYENEFKKMTYNSTAEMNSVIGKLEDNSFIKQEKERLAKLKEKLAFQLK